MTRKTGFAPINKLGTRHVQILILSMCMTIGSVMSTCLPFAIIAMTDTNGRLIHFKRFNWTNSEISFILSSYMWGYSVFQIPSSYIVSFWSAKKLFALGLFISSFVHVLIPFMAYYGDKIALCICRVIVGLCQSCFASCSVTLLSKWAPPKERSRLGSLVGSGWVFGGVLAMAVSGLIASSNIGWPGIFYIYGSIGVISSLVLFLVVTDCPTEHPRISSLEKTFIFSSFQEVNDNYNTNKQKTPWKSIFTSMPVWALIIVECGSNWGALTISTEMPMYLKYVLNCDLRENGLFSMLPYLANVILSFPFGWITDYLVRKVTSVSRARRIITAVAMWGSALALIALCLISTDDKKWPVLLFTLAVGLKAGTSSGFLINQIDLSQNFAGTIYSISTCFGTFVSMLAPLYCGIVVDDLKNEDQWHIVFYTTAIVYFLTNLVYVIFGRGNTQSWNDAEESTNNKPS